MGLLFSVRKTLWVLGSVVVAQGASAATILVDGFVGTKSLSVNVNFMGNTMISQAGAIAAHVNGGAAVEAYCVDLFNGVTIGSPYSATLLSTNGLSNGQVVAHLYNTYAPTIVLGGTYTTAGQVQEAGAALQLAIWDRLYDNGDGLSAGTFRSGVSG